MSVEELIQRLQCMPDQKAPVRVVLSEIWNSDDFGRFRVYFSDDDAIEAGSVTNQGPFVLIRSL